MVKIEFLDILYRWKVEAEQELEKLQETTRGPRVADSADWSKKIDDLEIKHAQELVNRYSLAIQSYMTVHN
jgi:hypothetical protein